MELTIGLYFDVETRRQLVNVGQFSIQPSEKKWFVGGTSEVVKVEPSGFFNGTLSLYFTSDTGHTGAAERVSDCQGQTISHPRMLHCIDQSENLV